MSVYTGLPVRRCHTRTMSSSSAVAISAPDGLKANAHSGAVSRKLQGVDITPWGSNLWNLASWSREA